MDSKIQGLTYAAVILVGCFAVMDGEMTTGALLLVQFYHHACWHLFHKLQVF
jgi:ABC-type bacteriocin/lantibiotic exporter with double-glycine peptidase domain